MWFIRVVFSNVFDWVASLNFKCVCCKNFFWCDILRYFLMNSKNKLPLTTIFFSALIDWRLYFEFVKCNKNSSKKKWIMIIKKFIIIINFICNFSYFTSAKRNRKRYKLPLLTFTWDCRGRCRQDKLSAWRYQLWCHG